jgi:hypothetical protein
MDAIGDNMGGGTQEIPQQPMMGSGPHDQHQRNRSHWMVASVVAALLIVVAGGASVFAWQTLGGGGDQPERFVPNNALGFIKLDLDPPAGQKVAAYEYLNRFPKLKGYASGEQDARQSLWNVLKKDQDVAKLNLDYKRDVEPWLGQRLGLAVLPPEAGKDEPEPLVTLQVTDEEKARTGIRKLLDAQSATDPKPGLAIRDGYAIIAADQAKADRFSQATVNANLETRKEFSEDLKGMGEGVLFSWADLSGVVQAVRDVMGRDSSQASSLKAFNDGVAQTLRGPSRYASMLNFQSDLLEMRGRVIGLKAETIDAAVSPISKLPENTHLAASTNGAGPQVDQVWGAFTEAYNSQLKPGQPTLDEFLGGVRAQYGINLPEDLKTLLGRSLVVAADLTNVTQGQQPKVGFRSLTDPAKAGTVMSGVQRFVREASKNQVPLVYQTTGDGVAVATDQAYLAQLVMDGTLGNNPAFRKVAPDVNETDGTLWVNVSGLVGGIGEEIPQPEVRDNLAHLDAVGMTATVTATDVYDFKMRVLAK